MPRKTGMLNSSLLKNKNKKRRKRRRRKNKKKNARTTGDCSTIISISRIANGSGYGTSAAKGGHVVEVPMIRLVCFLESGFEFKVQV